MSKQLNAASIDTSWNDLAPGAQVQLEKIHVGSLKSVGEYRAEQVSAGHKPEVVVAEVDNYETDYDDRVALFQALSIAAVKMASFPLGVQTVEEVLGMHLCLVPIRHEPGVAQLVFVFGDTELDIAAFDELEEFVDLADAVRRLVENEVLTPGDVVSEEVFDSYR